MVTAIEERYIKMHPESAKRFNVSKDLFPNGVTHDARNQMPFPHYITHAEGSHKWDVDGNKYLDLVDRLRLSVTPTICLLNKKGELISKRLAHLNPANTEENLEKLLRNPVS